MTAMNRKGYFYVCHLESPMKSIISLLSVLALAFAFLSPLPLAAKDKADPLAGDGLGKLKEGTKAEEVVKLLGKPEKKGEDLMMDATGLWEQEWKYPTQGLRLSMSSTKKGGAKTISTINAIDPCKLATARGIKIGSTAAEVRKAYQGLEDKDGPKSKETIVIGSVYGGIIFSMKAGKVDSIFIGAAAE